MGCLLTVNGHSERPHWNVWYGHVTFYNSDGGREQVGWNLPRHDIKQAIIHERQMTGYNNW